MDAHEIIILAKTNATVLVVTNLDGMAEGTGVGSRGVGAWCTVLHMADTRPQPGEDPDIYKARKHENEQKLLSNLLHTEMQCVPLIIIMMKRGKSGLYFKEQC